MLKIGINRFSFFTWVHLCKHILGVDEVCMKLIYDIYKDIFFSFELSGVGIFSFYNWQPAKEVTPTLAAFTHTHVSWSIATVEIITTNLLHVRTF